MKKGTNFWAIIGVILFFSILYFNQNNLEVTQPLSMSNVNTETNCFDGIDNNNNELIDFDDPDCESIPYDDTIFIP